MKARKGQLRGCSVTDTGENKGLDPTRGGWDGRKLMVLRTSGEIKFKSHGE